jgi:hypothetical protein
MNDRKFRRNNILHAARSRLLQDFRLRGWQVNEDTKVPYATSEDGTLRLYFRVYDVAVQELGDPLHKYYPLPLYADIRGMSSLDVLNRALQVLKRYKIIP